MNLATFRGQSMLFDLDGTLVDSVYEHVRAWHETFRDFGMDR
jgi:beta-phosphoglucomutase-like phosphatase (HAD superfamily)